MSLCRWEKGKEGVALARRENTEKQERKGGTTDVKHTMRIQAPNVVVLACKVPAIMATDGHLRAESVKIKQRGGHCNISTELKPWL